MESMRRKLVWADHQNIHGWGCSECVWVFSPAGPPIGESLEEMLSQYEQQRDKEFRSHACAKYPRATKNLH